MSDNEGLEEYEEVQTELRKKEEEEVCVWHGICGKGKSRVIAHWLLALIHSRGQSHDVIGLFN